MRIASFFIPNVDARRTNYSHLKFTSLAQFSLLANTCMRRCLCVQHNFILYVIKIHFKEFYYSNHTRFDFESLLFEVQAEMGWKSKFSNWKMSF